MMKYKIWNDTNLAVPTIYIHSFMGNGEDVWEAAHALGCPAFNLVSIYDFDADADLTPWPAEHIRKGQPPFSGKAQHHLKEIVEQLIPKVETLLPSPSSYVAMAGYSLAGLFTFWSCWQATPFTRIACVSSSFWYPGLIDFIHNHPLQSTPQCIYFSLGDKESQTKHQVMKEVNTKTEAIIHFIQENNIPTIFEVNEGNHFTETDRRTARGIQWILEQ